MYYLPYLCLLVYSGTLFFFILCTCTCTVSLDYAFFIAPSVFSSVYLLSLLFIYLEVS